MGQNETATENRRFGQYLRKIREQRRLSLDTVEEMSLGFRERVTKSHLSRIENGQAVPTFPRMFTLSQIYGVPVSSLAERFEVALIHDLVSKELQGKSVGVLREEGKKLRDTGRYREALQVYEALLDRGGENEERAAMPEDERITLALNRITCLVHLARYISAKEDCENLLGHSNLSDEHRAITLYYMAMSCYRLGKFTIATMVLERAKHELQALPESHELHAHLAGIEGNVMALTGRYEVAAEAYRRCMEQFEKLNQAFEACRFRLNLASTLIECGRAAEARILLRKVLDSSKKKNYDRQCALAYSSLGLLAFREEQVEVAEAHFLHSNSIARPREYYSVVFRNCYYLWKIATKRDDDAAKRVNERTLRAYLSRVEEFLPEAEEYRRHLAGGGR